MTRVQYYFTISRTFVTKFTPKAPSDKNNFWREIFQIREAFNELLADIHWMDDETRAVAKEKANAMNERIGYPDILTKPIELEKEYINVNF